MIRRINKSKLVELTPGIVFELDTSNNPITITLPMGFNGMCITLAKISNDLNNVLVTIENTKCTINEGQIIGFGGIKYKGKFVTLQFFNDNWEIVKTY